MLGKLLFIFAFIRAAWLNDGLYTTTARLAFTRNRIAD
jgi:hypothetical protein